MRGPVGLVFLLALASSPAPRPLTPALGGHVTAGDPRNPAVMPEQRIDLKFDHRVHVEDVGLGCTDCHGSVAKSQETSDLNLPARSACMECHDAAEIPVDWGPKAEPSAIDMPASHLHFSHARHLSDGIQCASCHADVATKTLATRDDLPSMEQCLSCHDGKQAPDDCLTCHLKGRGGTIRTSYDSGELKPDDHGVLWLRQHHVEAERDMGQCASCHAQEDCLACHDGSVPPTFHDGDYVALHPQDALANDPPCASCHRTEKFCADCHFRAQVRLNDRMVGGDGFHPAGWLVDGDSEHHRYAARKNLNACVSCHAGADCVSCHAFYTGAPRTHPSGWGTSRRMEKLMRRDYDLCLSCHDPNNPDDPIPPRP